MRIHDEKAFTAGKFFFGSMLVLVLCTPPAAQAQNVTFAGDILPILSRNCIGCHPGIPLTTYYQVLPWARAIDHLARDEQRYLEHTEIGGPLSPLTARDRETIHQWLQVAAPRETQSGRSVSYASDVQPIIARECMGCHSRQPIGMSLATYEEVRPWAKAVRRLADSNDLYSVHTQRGPLSEFLDSSEVEAIRGWVSAGAPAGTSQSPSAASAETSTATFIANNRLAFTLQDFDGASVSLDDVRFRNKVVLVDVWGTWCLPCAIATPHLVQLYNKYRPAGFEIVGIAYENSDERDARRQAVDAFKREFGISYTLLDGGSVENNIESTLPGLKNFEGFPTTIFIGRDGTVQRITVGFVLGDERSLERTIVELLSERADH